MTKFSGRYPRYGHPILNFTQSIATHKPPPLPQESEAIQLRADKKALFFNAKGRVVLYKFVWKVCGIQSTFSLSVY